MSINLTGGANGHPAVRAHCSTGPPVITLQIGLVEKELAPAAAFCVRFTAMLPFSPRSAANMDIEDTIERKSYRGFDLVHLRQGKAVETRWHITRRDAGMNCTYGFVDSEKQAHGQIDRLIDEAAKRPPV
jgi:hypothetical protein